MKSSKGLDSFSDMFSNAILVVTLIQTKAKWQKCDQSLSYLFLCRLGQGLDHEHSLHDIDLDGGRELYLYETIKSAYRNRFHFVSTRQKLYLYYSSRQRTSHHKG